MKFYSPLRYPGGKNKLARFIASLCVSNNISGHYVEPYTGGASVALKLLLDGYVNEITINDLDRSIYAFWHSILTNTNKFCRKIRNTEVTLNNWKRFRKIFLNKEKASLFDLGFATFFLNLTNRSEVIPFNLSGNSTYLKRAAFDVLECIANPSKTEQVGVGFVKDIPAEEIDTVREEGLKSIEKINYLFEAAFQSRMKRGGDFKLLDIKYMMPQVIDVETSLIPVEETE